MIAIGLMVFCPLLVAVGWVISESRGFGGGGEPEEELENLETLED